MKEAGSEYFKLGETHQLTADGLLAAQRLLEADLRPPTIMWCTGLECGGLHIIAYQGEEPAADATVPAGEWQKLKV